MNSDCPQHYALNASGKEAINLGSMSASGPNAKYWPRAQTSAVEGRSDLKPTSRN